MPQKTVLRFIIFLLKVNILSYIYITISEAYLMKNVIPSLTEGLLETCKVMPEDPVDYLAEYLFRVSPAIDVKKQGKK